MRTTGYIDEHGNYVRGQQQSMADDVSSMYKDWSHSLGRKEFAREIIQPHVDGKPNPEFIRAYPKYSKKYWNQEQIDKALRDDMGGQI